MQMLLGSRCRAPDRPLADGRPRRYAIGMDAPKPKLRWFQYSVRTLLIVVTLFAILCSWLGVKLGRYERQWAAAGAVVELGGHVDWPTGIGPGGDFVFPAEFVDLANTQATDADLNNLWAFWRLKRLSLSGTHVTDVGLENLKGLRHLQQLNLCNTKVTDDGVEKLQHALPNCTIER